MINAKQILLLHLAGHSGRQISKILGTGASRNVVGKVLRTFENNPLDADTLQGMTETDVYRHLFPESMGLERVQPDLELVHKELKKPGVTLKLLWEEYRTDCELRQEIPYQYSRFCDLYRSHVDVHGLTAPLVHKPGGEVMVDWAETTMWMEDPKTSKKKKLYIFVGTLPYSMYMYAQACPSMDEKCWIDAHVRMFTFFGGVPRLLISDNTKTAVIHNRKSEEILLNRA